MISSVVQTLFNVRATFEKISHVAGQRLRTSPLLAVVDVVVDIVVDVVDIVVDIDVDDDIVADIVVDVDDGV
jgi:hypothetical protein